MLNKAQIIGNIGNEPKISIINNNQTKVANFTVATTERGYTSQDGIYVQGKTEWHNIVCFGKLADVISRYTKKGSRIFIEGKMRTRSYVDNNGIKRNIMEINAENVVLLDNRNMQQQ
ncbi:MAG: single-stranded DNA-binding protein [Bacteroidales bacterium]|nr:single-stranded DNA-binding protein [Bacteroidales bacterium]